MDTMPRRPLPTASTPVAADPLEAARRLLDEGEPSLSELAARTGVSASHLQRRFRARFGLSPAEYLARKKLGTLKNALRTGSDVTTALYDAGYGSPSRLYEQGATKLGMTPANYRAGGRGVAIRWTVVDTVLGRTLVAATERGICAVELGDDDATLEHRLREEFPLAQLERVEAGRDDFLAPRLRAVAERLAGGDAEVPVDLLGTGFQQRVWEALMKIPVGDTVSYAGLAQSLGAPRAARAVASACAHNRIAVVVPCHRVIRGDGSLGGYRWGLPRKQHLVARERG